MAFSLYPVLRFIYMSDFRGRFRIEHYKIYYFYNKRKCANAKLDSRVNRPLLPWQTGPSIFFLVLPVINNFTVEV